MGHTRQRLACKVNSRPTIIFDLDGTLVDSRPAIVASLHYAQRQCGTEVDANDDLQWALGPPLRDILTRLLRTEDNTMLARGIAAYREHHPTVCLTDAQCYPGIHDALADLVTTSTLLLATSKLERVAISVVEHFGLSGFVDGICGSQSDGRLSHKVDVIRHLVQTGRLDPTTTVVVGDRDSDVHAARANRLRAVAVTYGYGGVEELRAAGPDVVCRHPTELPEAARSLL